MVSLGSVTIAVLYPILMLAFYQNAVLTVIAVIFAALVIYKHKENCVKIIKGTENKIGSKKDRN